MEKKGIETATFANGCFWCAEAVYQRLEGVGEVQSGFTGGQIKNPPYREVVQGRTGHAEGVQFEYDSEKISYRELLMVFFTTHDPTTLNRQGNDVGAQYRSAVFYHSEEQRKTATEVIQELNEEVFDHKIVTEITQASPFYVAEFQHQDFYNQHPSVPYCQIIIDPKLRKLRNAFAHKLKASA